MNPTRDQGTVDDRPLHANYTVHICNLLSTPDCFAMQAWLACCEAACGPFKACHLHRIMLVKHRPLDLSLLLPLASPRHKAQGCQAFLAI